MTLARIQQIALLCAGVLFCCCAFATVLFEKEPFTFNSLGQWLSATTAVLLSYLNGQPKGSAIMGLRFGKHVPAKIVYWLLSAFFTVDIIFITNIAYTSPRNGEFAGHNAGANLFVGCILIAIVLLMVVTGWLQIRSYLRPVDTSA